MNERCSSASEQRSGSREQTSPLTPRLQQRDNVNRRWRSVIEVRCSIRGAAIYRNSSEQSVIAPLLLLEGRTHVHSSVIDVAGDNVDVRMQRESQARCTSVRSQR